MIGKFAYVKAASVAEAIDHLEERGAVVHGGGTDLLGCLRDGSIDAQKVVSISGLDGLRGIRKAGKNLTIGALTTVDEIAVDAMIAEHYPAVAQAAIAVGSPQLRNQGTVGGNLCQRPRCWYFRGDFECLKKGGSRCYAVNGENHYHCIFGGGPCFIVFPSDLAPVLAAFDARVKIAGPSGSREMSLEEFYVLPEDDVRRETALGTGEIVTEVVLPGTPGNTLSRYRKVRARQVWDFALASAAIVLTKDGETIANARVLLGGVAPVPWRALEVERVLVGRGLDDETIRMAAEAAVSGAQPLEHNAYKVDLVRGIIQEELMAMR